MFENAAVTAAWAQTAIYAMMLAFLAIQIRLLRKQIDMQWRALRDAEYLRCQMDFTETLRLLIRSRLHTPVYDALARSGNSKFTRWSGYSEAEKTEYGYFELLYELLERIFVLYQRDDIDKREWRQWEGWVDDVVGNPVFADVHTDNNSMFDPEFEKYIADRLGQSGLMPNSAASTATP